MADQDQQSSPSVMGRISGFLRTRKGMVLAGEIILSLIVFICYVASRSGGYSVVAICEMIFAGIYFVVYSFEFDKQFRVIHWPWSDMIRVIIGCLLYFITSLIVIIRGYDGALIAGGVFGLIAGILFAYDAYIIIPSLKKTAHHTPAPTEPTEYA
ncbi:proteolipid protein 2 [Protopterus annectens]|uniref:proteolipid protein 2 n=1 Tax=Protopterus annectens TaxID=7888 RepID=UPI001CFC032A|nr:proteolipid protein 2 [Protopterus annectens]